VAEGNREFKGTEWAKTWVLWHDPLSIMYSKEGMAYMSSIGFGPRRHILCTDYTLPQKYWNVKPGKRAETNPCDEHLNADVEEAIKVLVLLSSEEPFHLAEGHPDIIPDGVLTGKYSKNRNKHRWLCNTVGELRRTYIEAFTNSPTQHRIREDILRIPVTLRAIVKAKGAALKPGATKFHYGGRRAATSAKRIREQNAARVRRTEYKTMMFEKYAYAGVQEDLGLELVYNGQPQESV